MDFGRITDPNAWRSTMANLLRRGEEVGTYIESAPQKAGQAIIDAGQRQRTLMNQAFDPTGKTLIRDPQAANQAAMNLFEGPLGVAPIGMTRAEIIKNNLEKINQPNKGDVLVNMPLSMIEHGESAMQGGKLTWPTAKDTIKSYAAKETPFPPIRVVGPYAGEAPNKIPFMIEDGSHRFEAAKLRGDKTIPTYITPEDYKLFKKLGGL